jgi:hypothetical protein
MIVEQGINDLRQQFLLYLRSQVHLYRLFVSLINHECDGESVRQFPPRFTHIYCPCRAIAERCLAGSAILGLDRHLLILSSHFVLLPLLSV